MIYEFYEVYLADPNQVKSPAQNAAEVLAWFEKV